ncbi:hypothetical protein SODALDRAFT_325605 [Sodiomyces alkalinus F11]|uniref:Uncharacterized protein n=1 Tax=Sodiomyces alkalinus (strain CBS 110278 / VKM F-3762 / F11) TaxID=1314773 RepID=A0A3N2PPF2_SODAK|nr:hypothetical protein SODALDRAFT_325605 [Sodiomyces alkalinus F11]ROT36236.1 hypothetical protein SODALDRAFT_325605 [Sodiomyces alkalinus F11]
MTPKSPVDEYAMGSDEEEEMANLAPGIADICTEAPPLSVALDMDEESDYDALFDHTHQYASLKTDSTIHSQHKHIDLLDEDIDWTDVSRVTECEAPDGSVPSAS